jgi:NAD(P)H-binding
METALRDSGLESPVIRPPRPTNGQPTGRYRTQLDGNVPKGRSIPRGDLAAAMLAIVGDRATVRHAIGVSS